VTRVIITDRADADAAEIIKDLTDKAGVLVADRYEADFDALYRRWESFPGSGSPRPVLGRLIRIGVVSPYVFVYRYTPDDDLVAVIRVLHGRRRITRRMLTPSTTRP